MEWTTPAFELSTLSASRREQLQRIHEAGLVSQGRVFLLSLEPIKIQMGARWPGRAEVIWEAVERSLHRKMPPPDVFVRLNDTTVIVAVASTNSYEGQIRCVETLQSLLFHFLGRSADADIALSRIASIDGDALHAEPVDVSPSTDVRTGSPARADPPRRPQDWTPPLTERRASGTIKLSHQGRTGYDIEIAPVWRLDLETISAYAVRLRLNAGPDRLSDLDQEALSQLVIDHLLPILEDYRREGGTFALIVPLSFSALSARRPRMALLNRCAELSDVMRRSVIAEITGLNAGVPSGLIRETVAMIRPFFRVVTAVVRTPADVETVYREASFHGVAVNWRPGPPTVLDPVVQAARRRTPNLIVHDVPNTVRTDELRRCRASHFTWSE